jgi:hypothetical protein
MVKLFPCCSQEWRGLQDSIPETHRKVHKRFSRLAKRALRTRKSQRPAAICPGCAGTRRRSILGCTFKTSRKTLVSGTRSWQKEGEPRCARIAATYVPAQQQVILTWSRNKNENNVRHEVRYAFENIHRIGWEKATPAPGGTIAPPGFQGYNGMVYTSTDIALEGRKTKAIFLAIRQVRGFFDNTLRTIISKSPALAEECLCEFRRDKT